MPLFDGGDDVGMVLSPQCFHNLNLHTDIFNHSNVHFWEYMQPGYDALGFISCTGTNFLVSTAGSSLSLCSLMTGVCQISCSAAASWQRLQMHMVVTAASSPLAGEEM